MTQNIISGDSVNTPIHILLADDDDDDRHFFKRVLEEIAISTLFSTVTDGEKLIEYLVKNSGNLPDLLFMDFNMPRKNGLQCMTEISGNPKLKHLPVIIYSTSLQEKNADLLYDLGAYYYVRKTDMEELKRYVNYILNMIVENKLIRPAREEFIVNLVEA